MTNTLTALEKLRHLTGERQITLRRKLMLYLLCLILAALGIILLILTAIGGPLRGELQVCQVMKQELQTASEKLSRELEIYAGYSLQLARELGQDIESYLDKGGISVRELNDRPEALLEVQRMMYSELNTTIRLGRSSGAFAVVDATVNTGLPNAERSRSGVYLRLINVSSNVILSPETILFRGNPEISRENGLELHNRWNMEFNTDELPGYGALMDGSETDYYWTCRMNLKNTWEEVILLLVPVRSSTGEVYGVCGIELNGLHFNLEYPAAISPCGSMVTVLAPAEGESLRLDLGMAGNTEGTWLKNSESLSIVERKGYYNAYRSSKGAYYGIQKPLEIPGYEGRQWAVAVLMPREGCDQYIFRNRLILMGSAVGFTLTMILLALYLSKRFVRPILQSFQDIREERLPEGETRQIAEVEELRQWLQMRARTQVVTELPPNMLELLDRFAANVKTLTRAEYNIFQYYMNGYQVSQIPEVAFISMSTVKKHNGNIYRKLGISSNDELMVYLDLFRRCDCLERLQPEEAEKPGEEPAGEIQ